jgi:hypothetical protein
MNQRLLIILLVFLTLPVIGQEFMTRKGLNPIPATSSWGFICENYALTGTAIVQIAKSEKGGILKLSVETTDSSFTISGIAHIYLSDNTVITCSDKGNHETTGNQITSYYLFSNIEMSKLKTTDIESIHFNINGKTKNFSSQLGSFTALNKKNYFATAFDKSKKSFDTAKEIKALYK